MRWFFLFTVFSCLVSCQTELDKKLEEIDNKIESDKAFLKEIAPLGLANDSLIAMYDSLNEDLIRITGGYDESSKPVGLFDSIHAYEFFFQGNGIAKIPPLIAAEREYYALAYSMAKSDSSRKKINALSREVITINGLKQNTLNHPFFLTQMYLLGKETNVIKCYTIIFNEMTKRSLKNWRSQDSLVE